MEQTTALTAIAIFLISIYFSWKILCYYNKKQLGEKMYKKWNSRLYLWQGVIFTSTGATFLIMFLLKWTNVVAF